MATAKTHFTHHSCGAIGIDWGGAFEDRPMFHRVYEDRHPYGGNGNSPRGPYDGCKVTDRARHRGAGAWDILSTTNPRKVTCATCRREMARDLSRAGWERSWRTREWVSDRVLTERTWFLCCRDRGAPFPFGAPRLAEIERDRVAKLIAGKFTIASMGVESPDDFARWIPSDLHDVLRPALDELTMAKDLLEEVERMRARAQAIIDDVTARVRGGALALDTAAALDHIFEAKRRDDTHERRDKERETLEQGVARVLFEREAA